MCSTTDASIKLSCAAEVALEALAPLLNDLFPYEDCLATAVTSVVDYINGGCYEFRYGYPYCSSLAIESIINNSLNLKKLTLTDF